MEIRYRNDKAKLNDNRLLTACIASALLAGGFGTPALAGSAQQIFDIPAQPMDSALTELADRAGLRLLYQAGAVGALRSRPVSGRHTPEQALRIMLADSGLEYRKTAGDAITVEKSPKQASTPAPENTVLSPMTVSGAAEYDSTDPYNADYNRTRASTATRTDTPIMETPFSIKTVPQQVLQDQQVFRLEKALQNVSGALQHPSGQGVTDAFILRGFEANTIYRDGFPLPFNGQKRDTANLERVEVLKGPGSILYGRSEPGGVVNLVTKQPLSTPYYSLQQQFGSFGFYRTTADATGPITQDDTLLYRINLSYENAGSFRDFVDNERVFIAPVLKWNISPSTQATLELEFQHFDEPQDPGIPNIGNRPAAVPRERFLGEPLENKLEGDRVMAGFHWSHDFNDNWTIRHRFTTELINYDTRGLSFNAAQPDGTLNRRFFNSSGTTADFERYYTSLNLTGKVSTWMLKHTLLFGFDYNRSDDAYLSGGGGLAAPAFNIFRPVYMAEPLAGPAKNFTFATAQSWYGLYFQDQIELPYHVFALAGFRYDNADGSTNLIQGDSVKDDRLSPRGGLLWRPLTWLSLYGSYTENFGAANSLYNPAGQFIPPQSAQQWEMGAKTEFWDGRLSATFSYFDLTKQNIAVTDYSKTPAFTQIIGEAETRGVEFDIAGEILPGWRIIGAYTHMPFAEITRDVGSDGGLGNQGKRLFQAPEHMGSLWNTYEFLGGDLRGLKFGAGVVAVGQREGNSGNSYQMPGYATVNLLTSYSMKVGLSKLTAQLNVDNLLDKTYYTGSNSINLITFGAPRTFLGSLRLEF